MKKKYIAPKLFAEAMNALDIISTSIEEFEADWGNDDTKDDIF